ncbi:MAG: hypothetical protein HY669_03355 [Chloroflexi bacterium]|nr:hypothetical protein [Chloroflexota bacterium]
MLQETIQEVAVMRRLAPPGPAQSCSDRSGEQPGQRSQPVQGRPDLATLLSPLLKQYERSLTERMEAEARDKALATVKEEVRVLHCQIRDNLLSIESQLQQEMEAFISQARQHLFKDIRGKMDSALEDLDVRLQDTLGLAKPSHLPWQYSANDHKDEDARPPAAEPAQDEAQPQVASEDTETYQREVTVQIKPPLSPPSLIGLYRCLSQMPEVSIISALGSADKGATLELRLTEPAALQKVMSKITSVQYVQQAFDKESGNCRRTIYVLLRPSSAERIADHG